MFQFDFPLLKALFLERPNRFAVQCDIPGVGVVRAFMPNPGRLWELLYPGVTLHVARIPPAGAPRKTEWTVIAVERDGRPIMLHTHYTNDVAGFLLRHNAVPGLEGGLIVQREVPVGRSRFDFLLNVRGEPFYLEVKSCTLFGNGVAMFPDAITERGRRHLMELAHLRDSGVKTGVMFVVHSPLVDYFMPDYHTDLAFARTLIEVRRKVKILPVAIDWSPALTLPPAARLLAIPWRHVIREADDRGGLIMIYRLADALILESREYPAGWYVYFHGDVAELAAAGRSLRTRRLRPRSLVERIAAVAVESQAVLVRKSRLDLDEFEHRFSPLLVSVAPEERIWFAADAPLRQRSFQLRLEAARFTKPGT